MGVDSAQIKEIRTWFILLAKGEITGLSNCERTQEK